MNTPQAKQGLLVFFLLLFAGGLALLFPLTNLTAQQPQSEQRQGPIRPQEKKKDEPEPFTMRVDASLVNLSVTAMTRNGDFIPNLQREQFRVYVDKEEVEVVAFAPSEAPITTVMLVEANANLSYYLTYRNLEAVALFLRLLKKGDWIALVGYDMKTRIEADFTQNQMDILNALRRMQFPAGFRESNFYDALIETLDRIKDIEGRKSIIVIGTGVDTFSKHNWGQTRKLVREHNTTIFALGMSFLQQLQLEGSFGTSASIARGTLILAEAQLKDLARKSGGKAYFPRFQAELPNIYREVGAILRNQYTIAFRPDKTKRDGKYHKVKVELVGPGGEKLKVVDQNGKNLKYKLYYRAGFYAPAE